MTYTITISLSRRQLNLYSANNLIKSYPVAVGKNSTPTPTGNFYVVNKRLNPGGPFGAMWMGLSLPGYGIHGTNSPPSIGKYVSKGCIRMYNKDVIELSRLIPIGTPVTIMP